MLVDKIQRLVPTDRCPVSTQVGYRTNDWTLPEPVTPSYLAAAPMRPFRSSSQNGSDLKPDMKFNNILPGD